MWSTDRLSGGGGGLLNLEGGLGGEEEVVVDGEGSALDGWAEGAAGVGVVVRVQVGEGGEGGDNVRRVGARLQHLL